MQEAMALEPLLEGQCVQYHNGSERALRQDAVSHLPSAVVSQVLHCLWHRYLSLFPIHDIKSKFLLSQNRLPITLRLPSEGHKVQYRPPRDSESLPYSKLRHGI